MKIVYFIMLHRNPAQFEWLWKAIYNDNDYFLIHIDRKSSKQNSLLSNEHQNFVNIAGNNKNVHLMRSRNINWGGWTLSKLQLDAIGISIKSFANWSYFIPLSGQCYPIKSLDELRYHLSKNFPTNFIEMHKISDMDDLSWHHKRMPMIELPFRAIRIPIKRKSPSCPKIDWTGSQWCTLSREFCQWIADVKDTHNVCRYLSHTILSDELIMQNLLANSQFSDKRTNFLHYLEWPGPKVFNISDLKVISNSNKFFARKFDINRCQKVIEAIANRNNFHMP